MQAAGSALAARQAALSEQFLLKAEVEAFLVLEAELLDEWRLDEWITLLSDDVRYMIPPLDLPEADYRDTLFLISDDRATLISRAKQLMGKMTWAESPRSRTRRLVSNVRVLEHDADELVVTANFIVWAFQNGNSNPYVGRYIHRLVRGADGSLLFRERKTLFDLETLRPHGKLSLII